MFTKCLCVLSFHVPFDSLVLFFELILVYSLSLCSFMLAWHGMCALQWAYLTWCWCKTMLCIKIKMCTIVCALFPRDLIWWHSLFFMSLLSCQLSLTCSCLFASFPHFDPVHSVLRGRLQFLAWIELVSSYLAPKRSGDGEESDPVLEIYHMMEINRCSYS